MASPELMVEQFARFCQLSPNDEQIQSAAANVGSTPKAYLLSSRLHYQGKVERVEGRRVLGWVRATNASQSKRIEVELQVNNKTCDVTIANEFREDLKNKKIGDARYGFALKLPKDISSNDTIRVKLKNTNYDIENNGKHLSEY